ncbi:unnamed protein product, partial [Durusdinium trenchii]
MSTPSSKIKIPKKKSGDKNAPLSRLLGDSFASPSAAPKTVPPSGSRSKRRDDLSKEVGGVRDEDDSLSGVGLGDSDELTPDHPLYGSIRSKDMDTVVVDSNPDVSSDLLPTSARDLRAQGVVPLSKVTLGDLLEATSSQELRARSDYPDWELFVSANRLPGICPGRLPLDEGDVRAAFSSVVRCRNDSRQLAEILCCILSSSEWMDLTYLRVDRLFRELWVFLFRNGIGADDALALLDYGDLKFDVLCPILNQLATKKSLWHIVQAVRIAQGCPERLYLSGEVRFSAILRIVSNPSLLQVRDSTGDSSQRVPSTVSFDPSVKGHAPPDLDLPLLAVDASDFLDYRKSVEYVFQSRGVKQYLTETDEQKLVSSWSEAFCARLHASIAKSTISYINEQLKNETSVARLWDGIKNCFDDAGQQLDRELRQWITLFNLSVDHVDDFAGFLNTYKTAISQLRSVNSIALGDDAVMRALIIRAVSCEEFHSVMIDLSKNRHVKPDDMIKALEDHYRAFQHRATIAGNPSSTKQARRGGMRQVASGDA